MRNKPAENTTFTGAALVAAVLAVFRAYGYNIPPQVDTLCLLLVGAIPHAVTWFVNWRAHRDNLKAGVKVGREHG